MKVRYFYICLDIFCDNYNNCLNKLCKNYDDVVSSCGCNYLLLNERKCEKCMLIEHFYKSLSFNLLVLFIKDKSCNIKKGYIFNNRYYDKFFVDDSFLDALYNLDTINKSIMCQQLENLRKRIFQKENIFWFVVLYNNKYYIVCSSGLKYMPELNVFEDIEEIKNNKEIIEHISNIVSPEVLWNRFVWDVSIKSVLEEE